MTRIPVPADKKLTCWLHGPLTEVDVVPHTANPDYPQLIATCPGCGDIARLEGGSVWFVPHRLIDPTPPKHPSVADVPSDHLTPQALRLLRGDLR